MLFLLNRLKNINPVWLYQTRTHKLTLRRMPNIPRQWRKRYLWPKCRLIRNSASIINQKLSNLFHICKVGQPLLVVKTLLQYSKRFYEFCVEVTLNCHSTNSDYKPCPQTLQQGFFVKSGKINFSLNKSISRTQGIHKTWFNLIDGYICIDLGGTNI